MNIIVMDVFGIVLQGLQMLRINDPALFLLGSVSALDIKSIILSDSLWKEQNIQ